MAINRLTEAREHAARRILERTVRSSGGNLSEVARRLGIARRVVKREMARVGIDPDRLLREIRKAT